MTTESRFDKTGQACARSEPYAIGLLRSMLQISSPSYGEGRLAAHLVGVMREMGFSAYVDEAGNAVGEISRGDGPTVMLLGHMDTVPGDIPVRIDCGRLYGRGAVDAKGPLAAMVCAAADAVDFRGRIVVVGAVEEETPLSRGAVHIRRTHAAPDALVIGEPSGWQTAVLGYKGKLDLRYRVECPPTHPSNPVPKASELACAAWPVLLELLGPQAGHGGFDVPGATLVSIRGDLTEAEAEFDVRTPPGYDAAGLVERLAERLPGRLEVVNSVAACRVGRTDPVVRALSAGIRAQRARPVMKVKTGTSDMNTLAEEWDVPMATYGPGDSRLDHADDEHIALSDFLRGIDVLTHALHDLGERLGPRHRLSLVPSLPARPVATTDGGA
ncbi:M20/M25/M40 family metallo-hydrolase [Streptomyces albireticuli]|uniref:Acetyl-lysine deacetylase n=1 Tax=Streptomyces albireticuli TaxID=1940 RepID=A0A2A2D8P3_9ACTN|nr:M20/M25/M40 family metallo-hydrolase [Streptomyces albireticuli]MCD9196219.1 M20/M25/M40 family metallo-hydrolase [Streptomyces albireticuli]PAU47817.1 acetyl-lysine deacetylase [Streptomyces albireticuli]